MKKIAITLLKILIDVLIALGILMIIQSQIITLTRVYQWSMYETLSEGDLLITEKISYRFREPQRGDIVILLAHKKGGFWGTKIGVLLDDYKGSLTNKEPRTRYVKRVIGLPGDVITMQGGVVYINGEQLEEEYALGDTRSHSLLDSIVVPEECVFVLGDNRESSLDSRYFGAIPIENVESRVVVKVWPHFELFKN